MGIPGVAPAHLGRYERLARLATGGMGESFLARLEGAVGFEKQLVIKRILPHLADDPRFRDMLIRALLPVSACGAHRSSSAETGGNARSCALDRACAAGADSAAT